MVDRIYLTLDTLAPGYDDIINILRPIHEDNAGGAELSIAKLKNDKVLVKVCGLNRKSLLARKLATLEIFDGDDKAGRLAHYHENRFIPEIDPLL